MGNQGFTVRVRKTDPWFSFRPRLTVEAKDSKGRVVGTLKIRRPEAKPYPGWKVDHIEVDPAWRRRGVATRLYEEGAKAIEKKYRKPLCSDLTVAPEAKEFWEKQVRKGRAQRQKGFYCFRLPVASLQGTKKSRKKKTH